MSKCFVFPGQGSQFIGMGQALYTTFATAKNVFDAVDDALNFKVSDVMFSGDADVLNMTENTQPAVMAVSVAVSEVLKQDFNYDFSKHATYMAGHSLGEYSALCTAEVLDVATTAKLLKLRGQAMQRAVPVGVGAMAAVLGIDFATAEQVSKDASDNTHQCSPANDNIDGQVVISGHAQAIQRAIPLAKQAGAKRAMLLPVSAPFHCPLMESARLEMAEALAQTQFTPPIVPIVTNVTAQPQTDTAIICQGLIDQVCGRVRWRETLITLQSQGVNELVELGAGKVLSGMVRRIAHIKGISIQTPQDIEQFMENFVAQ